MTKKKPSLGRGLGALLGETKLSSKNDKTKKNQEDLEYSEIPIEFINKGKYQPRKDMDQEPLEELALSIKAHGVMQPVVVRITGENKYELIAGERRWKASQLAGKQNIPAIIKKASDAETMAMALIENIQREDLNPMDEAVALLRLREEFGLTQQQVAEAVGRSRVAITNILRLNNLDEKVKTMLKHGDIDMGHARALLGIPIEKQEEAAQTIILKGFSVRQTEALVRTIAEKKLDPSREMKKKNPNLTLLEENLSVKIGSRVNVIETSKGKGRLIIKYCSLDELDGILTHIN